MILTHPPYSFKRKVTIRCPSCGDERQVWYRNHEKTAEAKHRCTPCRNRDRTRITKYQQTRQQWKEYLVDALPYPDYVSALRTLYRQWRSCQKVGDILCVSHMTVYNDLKAIGEPLRGRGGAH